MCVHVEGIEGREGRENLRKVLRLKRPLHLQRTEVGPTGLKEGARWYELR